jgi:beta-glucosidase
MAGMDQFGGNNEKGPVLDAYRMGAKEYGEEFMRSRFEGSAVRLLRNMLRTGLFENPYLDPSESMKTVGNAEFMKAGYEAQVRSVVMLKNHSKTLPLKKHLKVYIPKRYSPAGRNWFGQATPEQWTEPISSGMVSKYYQIVDSPDKADFALVCIASPAGGSGYDKEDLKTNGNGYIPVSLQYDKYKADFARESSIAGGSPFENFTNRSYKGKSTTAQNSFDKKMVNETKAKMGGKQVVVLINVSNPMVFSEIENAVSAIIVHLKVQDQALMDIISGDVEPSGLCLSRCRLT